jgi:hypothetical protein
VKRVCIHQPDFAPYLGFFHRLLLADQFIVLDDVQFERRGGWHYRDKIKTPQGERWLALSTLKGALEQKINEVRLVPGVAWRNDCLNLLSEHYRKAPFYGRYFPAVRDIFLADHTKMIELNMAILRFFWDIFDIRIDPVFSSSIPVPGRSSQRLIHLVKAVGGTHYLTGTGSRAYLDETMFRTEGIAVEWQDFHPPVYPQLFGPFIPNLSCLDVLFNCGPGAKDVLRSCLAGK